MGRSSLHVVAAAAGPSERTSEALFFFTLEVPWPCTVGSKNAVHVHG